MTPTREQIISEATAIDPEGFGHATEYSVPGKFQGASDGELAAALYTIWNNGHFEVECSNPGEGTGAFALIDRWIIRADAEGFITLEEYESNAVATEKFADRASMIQRAEEERA